jgi:hypothetical protein
MNALRVVGADGQVTALASPAAANASLDGADADDMSVAKLLYALHAAGTRAQAIALIERLPAAGKFALFCEQEGRAAQFRFGREADGRPARPWGWTDLG